MELELKKRKIAVRDMLEQEGAIDKDKLRQTNLIVNSYAGGEKGRELFPSIISEAFRCLRNGGIFYFLIIEDNEPQVVLEMLNGSGFGKVEVLSMKKFYNEKIYILKCFKN